MVDAYSCMFAGVLLVAGSVGDRVGRTKALCVGLAVFGTGSALSAFATSVSHLEASRALMGLGAACVIPATLSIITDIFRDPGEQARAIGFWSGTTGQGIAIDPIAGGWLRAHFWWGSIFLVNVPVATVGIVVALVLVPDSRDPVHRPIDGLGAVKSTAGLTMLVWSIIEIPQRGWQSPSVAGARAVALVEPAGFVLWERHTSHPMLVLGPFGDRRFSVAMVAVALAVFALMGALFVLTQYLQFSLGFSPLATGVRILPIAAVLAVGRRMTSPLLDRWLGTKVVVATGLLAVSAGLWRLTTTTTAEGFGHALAGMVLLGLGAGLIIALATASVMGSLPRQRAGVGSATNSTALQVGGALGVAVIGSVLSAHYQDPCPGCWPATPCPRRRHGPRWARSAGPWPWPTPPGARRRPGRRGPRGLRRRQGRLPGRRGWGGAGQRRPRGRRPALPPPRGAAHRGGWRGPPTEEGGGGRRR